jgi:hypothetical protein
LERYLKILSLVAPIDITPMIHPTPIPRNVSPAAEVKNPHTSSNTVVKVVKRRERRP